MHIYQYCCPARLTITEALVAEDYLKEHGELPDFAKDKWHEAVLSENHHMIDKRWDIKYVSIQVCKHCNMVFCNYDRKKASSESKMPQQKKSA